MARLIDFAIAFPLAFVLVLPIVVVLAPIWMALGTSGIDDWENRIWGPIGGSVCLFLSFVVLETVPPGQPERADPRQGPYCASGSSVSTNDR